MSDQELAKELSRIEESNTATFFSQSLSDSLILQQNWGQLLTAAPLALSNLGNCQIVAASPAAGSLTLKRPEGVHEILPYTTLRANLTHLCSVGAEAFLEAERRLEAVSLQSQYLCSEKGPLISIIQCLQHEQAARIDLPHCIESLSNITTQCQLDLESVERHFKSWLKGANTLMEVAVETEGDTEAKTAQDNRRLKQLQLEETGMESRVKEMGEHVDQMKSQMKLSEEAFKSAQEASNKTNPWESIGLALTEGLAKSVVNITNGFCNFYMHRNLPTGVQNSPLVDEDVSSPHDVSGRTGSQICLTTTSPDWEVGGIPALDFALQLLMNSTTEVLPDQTVLDSVKAQLGIVSRRIRRPCAPDSLSAQMDSIVNGISQICSEIDDAVVRERQLTKVEHQSDWKAWQARLKNVATGLSLLKARVESAPGQGMGAKPPRLAHKIVDTYASIAQSDMARKAAEFQVTASNLDSSRARHDAATQRLNDDIAAVRRIQGELAVLSTDQATLKDVRRVLAKAIFALSKLQQEIGALLSFFQSLSAIIQTTAQGPCADVVRILERGMSVDEKRKVNGFDYLAYKKQDVFSLTLMIRARFNVVYDVSKLYTTVSRQYIMPGVGIVNRLGGSTRHFEDENGMLIKVNNVINDTVKLQQFTDDACTQIVLLAKKKQESVRRREQQRSLALENISHLLPVPEQAEQIEAVVKHEAAIEVEAIKNDKLLPSGEFEDDF